MKISLVAINSKYIHSNLAIRYLRAYTKDLYYTCIIKEFTINDRVERLLEEILKDKPDVIGFSTYIWNIDFIEKLSKLIKLVDSNIQIFYGGPEVSYDAKDMLKDLNGDYIIEGEGEVTYGEFVKTQIKVHKNRENIENIKEQFKGIKGLYTKDDLKIYYGGYRPLMNMNDVVFPYEEDEDLSNKIVYYEFSRGCPFNCKYCLSSTVHGVRFLELEKAKKEIQFFIDKEVKLIKFVDRTFNCNHEFSVELWDYMIKNSKETSFHFEISADILTKEEIEVLKKSPEGMFQFEVGVQTTNDTVLHNINRFVNFSDIKEKVDELLKIKNIKQHLDLIAGLPGENYNSFVNSFNDVYSIRPEEIQLGFLKLLKGSLMRAESEKWGMVASPYPPYEILKNRDISYDELLILKRVEHMVDKYYNSQKFNTIIKYFDMKYDKAFDLYLELGNYFYDKGYFERKISSVEYYKLFLDFNSEILKEDNEVLKEIIKYDYLKHNKKRWLPPFLDRISIDKEVQREKIKKYSEKKEINEKLVHLEVFKIDIEKFLQKSIIEKKEKFKILT